MMVPIPRLPFLLLLAQQFVSGATFNKLPVSAKENIFMCVASAERAEGFVDLIAKPRLRQEMAVWREDEVLATRLQVWETRLEKLGKTLELRRSWSSAEASKVEEAQIGALVKIANFPRSVLRWWLFGVRPVPQTLPQTVPQTVPQPREKRVLRLRNKALALPLGTRFHPLLFDSTKLTFRYYPRDPAYPKGAPPTFHDWATFARAKIALAFGSFSVARQRMPDFFKDVMDNAKWELVPEPVDVDDSSSSGGKNVCRNCPPKYLALRNEFWFSRVFLPLAQEWGSAFLSMKAVDDPRPLSWFFRMAIQVETFQPLWRYYPGSYHWTQAPKLGWGHGEGHALADAKT